MSDEIDGFYEGDGTKINPELVSKPSLCITCKRDDAGGEEVILCILNRIDKKDDEHFKCDAYESKFK
jgi:hypothetical protein